MELYDVLKFSVFILVIIGMTPILGSFMAKVFEGENHLLQKPLGWLERISYKIFGIDHRQEMTWKEYSKALLVFNLLGIVIIFLFQILQNYLPLNPQSMPSVSWHSALNTAISFVTNTNWQGYAGEVTMSYFTQMGALTVQNFLSAAVGLAVAIALTRGIARRSSSTIGNYWADLVRGIIYILLPISFVYAIILIGLGTVQTFAAYLEITTLEGAKQLIPFGPVASQTAIKMLGTNGGGFFNANSAHPFENPTGLTNFLQIVSIFLIPAALTYTFGTITKARRHGWIIFGTMMFLFIMVTSISLYSEGMHNPVLGFSQIMEGKETRFGFFDSVFFSSVTTSASCGAINSLHSSLSPLSGGIALLNMMLGEVIFGGVGAGLYGMMLFILMTVFIAGLMVGRTPEYLGKKIESKEMAMMILAILAPCVAILVGTGITVMIPAGLSSLANKGPHGFGEILYAFTSAAANNGSAFAGLNANTLFYNLMLGAAMLIGRFAIIVPILAVAGGLAQKKLSPANSGTFEVHTPLFSFLLILVILIVGALTFLPALSLGPIVEHLMMIKGQSF